VHHLETRISHAVLAAHRFEVLGPALPVRRVGEHEVELLRGEGVVCKRGPLRAADDVVGAFAFALEQHVRLADGVSLGIDLLAVEQGSHLLLALRRDAGERVLGNGKHAAGAAGAVVKQVGAGLDLLLDGQEDEVGHQANGVAWCPVFAGLFVILFVKLADQFFKHRSHGMVIYALGRKVDRWIEKF